MLEQALRHAEAFLATLPERPVGPPVDRDALQAALAHGLTDEGVPPEQVIDELVAGVDRGLVACAGPRYFGFVTGGALPAALAADWLTAAWDQNAFSYVSSPAASVVEQVVEGWVLDVLGLPGTASVGFATGAQMANATCLAVARDAMLARAGWDAARDGLIGAPPLTVIAGEEAHATIFTALRLIGLGRESARLVAVDDQGALDPAALNLDGPAIVCAQAGNVNSGAFDPLDAIADACEAAGAWLHVDGAFGLWAAASPAYRHLTAGIERADSWATDGHKWLNVPYDCGLAIVADREAHRRAMGITAAYLPDDRPARADRVHARGLAPRPRLRALRGAAVARPPRARGDGRAPLRAGGDVRPAALRRRRRDPQRRRPQPGARGLRARRRRARSRPTARAGPAAPSGAGGPRCASRSRAGRPRTPTSSARRGRC